MSLQFLPQGADNFDWYYTEVPDGSGGIYKVYMSALGASSDGSTSNVTALVARYNQALGINETQGKIYSFAGSTWGTPGTYASLPGSGGVGTASVSSSESMMSVMFIPKIKTIDFNEMKINLRNKLLEKIGLTVFDFYEQEIQMLTQGVATGIDDNFFFGLFQKVGSIQTHYDDSFFITGKIVVDAAAVVYFAGLSGTANAAADAAFAGAAATAAAGGLTALTGVGAPLAVVEEGGALVQVVAGVVGKVVAVAATAASARSANILRVDSGKLGNLPGSGGTPSSPQFKSQSLLDGHYQKHVIEQGEFGNITKSEYLKRAQDLVTSTPGGNILQKTRSNGDKLFYNQVTSEFGVVTKDNVIRTFFKPSNGINYFNGL